VSITGFDDLDIAARSILPLTTVRVAAEGTGC
jgi:DNA-binding LacI/PurR family transcriptional regulator